MLLQDVGNIKIGFDFAILSARQQSKPGSAPVALNLVTDSNALNPLGQKISELLDLECGYQGISMYKYI